MGCDQSLADSGLIGASTPNPSRGTILKWPWRLHARVGRPGTRLDFKLNYLRNSVLQNIVPLLNLDRAKISNTGVLSHFFFVSCVLFFSSLSQFVTLVSNHTHVNLCALSSLMMRVDESRHNSSSSVLTTPTLSRKIQRVLNHSSVTPSVCFMCVCVVLLGFGGFQVCVGQVYVYVLQSVASVIQKLNQTFNQITFRVSGFLKKYLHGFNNK